MRSLFDVHFICFVLRCLSSWLKYPSRSTLMFLYEMRSKADLLRISTIQLGQEPFPDNTKITFLPEITCHRDCRKNTMYLPEFRPDESFNWVQHLQENGKPNRQKFRVHHVSCTKLKIYSPFIFNYFRKPLMESKTTSLPSEFTKIIRIKENSLHDHSSNMIALIGDSLLSPHNYIMGIFNGKHLLSSPILLLPLIQPGRIFISSPHPPLGSCSFHLKRNEKSLMEIVLK